MTDWKERAREAWDAPSWKAVAEQDRRKVVQAEIAKTNGGAKPETPPSPSIEELEAAAGDLIYCPNILYRFGESVESIGLVGETKNAKILFLSLTTRTFERPVSVAIKGASSVGKSHTVECVLKHFPPEAYFERTGLSEKALAYSQEDFRHRHIVIYEAAGMNSDFGSYLIRSLLSEGRLIYEFVEKTKFGMRPRLIEKPGPTGLITTTTSARLHPENETRLLSLASKDDKNQTEAVIRALAEGASGEGKDKPANFTKWHALQRWILAGECRVVVPFAVELGKLIPPVAVRLRRDFTLLLSLIKAHALLHRKSRPTDERGRVVATLEDYAAVRDLIADLFAEGIEATVPETVRQTVEAVKALGGVDVSLTVVAAKLQLDKNPTHHRVRKAIERGFLVNNEPAKGRPLKLAIGDPIPDATEILPGINTLRSCCTVVVDPGGERRKTAEVAKVGPTCEAGATSPFTPQDPPQHYNGTPSDFSRQLTNGEDPAPICAQCGAADPGPLLHVLAVGGEVRLHRECRKFWLKDHPQPRGAAIACVQIAELPATGTPQ
jgi:hypothetical protein